MNAVEINVEKIVDHPDGTATITFDVSLEALKVFAAIGLHQLLIEKAKEILDGHSDVEGTGNTGSGEGGDKPLPPEFPGF